MIKTLTKMATALALVAFMSSSQAATLTFADAIGTVRVGEPAGTADETTYVNNLLGLNVLNTATVIDGHTYLKWQNVTGTVGAGVQDDTSNSGTGVGYLLAKYDGPNGGDVLWAINGDFTIPQNSGDLWENNQGNGYGLSHFTLYTGEQRVPDGGATVALLGVGLLGLGAMRRKVS